ncbi:hypothetical protein [Arthrobacter sp. StoSoilB20]|uniref:hypothetical protein n=1 Tax=Arthrobacter sp. StoSoilB20 TaxID=2830995 RepID=UPI001CC3CC9C|nr:hypothetical protein [Arthrobacter sp. StoSoilB20]
MQTTRPDSGLIDGPTAFVLWRWRYRFTTITLALCLFLLVLSRSGVPQSWFITTLLVLMMVTGFLLVILIGWCSVRELAEKESGYTTLRTRRNELNQRDPYLGQVIRPAGAPSLTRQQFLKIIETAKVTPSK